MKLDTTIVLKQVTGEPYKDGENDLTIGKTVAKILANDAESKDPLKSSILAQKIYQNDEVELDKSDIEFIKTTVLSPKNGYLAIIKGQIVEILDDLKEKKDK